MTSSKPKATTHDLEIRVSDTQSVHSDSASTKPKKKKSTTKAKKVYFIYLSLSREYLSSISQDETAPTTDKTKKKKKTTSTKAATLTTEAPVAAANDDDNDDLESFLADNPTNTRQINDDYEDI